MNKSTKLKLFAFGVITGTVLTVVGGVTGLFPLLLVGPLLFLLLPLLSRYDQIAGRRRSKQAEKAWCATPVTMPIVPAPPLDLEDEAEEEMALVEDVVDALVSLGYRKGDSRRAAERSGAGPVEERIVKALQIIGQG